MLVRENLEPCFLKSVSKIYSFPVSYRLGLLPAVMSALQRETPFLTSDRLRAGSLSRSFLTFTRLRSPSESPQGTGLTHSSWALGSRSGCTIPFLASSWRLRPTKFHRQFLKLTAQGCRLPLLAPKRQNAFRQCNVWKGWQGRGWHEASRDSVRELGAR